MKNAESARLFSFGRRIGRRWVRAGGDCQSLIQDHKDFLVADNEVYLKTAGETKSVYVDDPFARGVMKEVFDAVQSAH